MSDAQPACREPACAHRARRHIARLAACRAAGEASAVAGRDGLAASPRNGSRWQRPRRTRERTARVRSVAFARWAQGRGLPRREIAGMLHVSSRTLRHWRRQWRSGRLQAAPRGRPPARSSRPQRRAVLDLLHTAGPALPVEALRAQFPQMAAAELKRLLRRYRRDCRRRREARPQRLHWFAPGAVWAMDFVEHLGGLSWVFSVRDLASRHQLLWQQVSSPNAEVVIAALRKLFEEHGPPLVLKSDNGSAFIAAETLDLLAEQRVVPLFNPARRPQYNGGCERGGGILKGYTYQVAQRADRPGVCLLADLEAARELANALSRPWGRRGPAPRDAWSSRPRLTLDQREAFEAELTRCRSAACVLLEYPPDEPLSRAQAARRDRRAVQATLEALGYLQVVACRDPLLRRPPTGQCAPAPTGSVAHTAATRPTAPEKKSAALPASPAEKPCTLEAGPASRGPMASVCDQPPHVGSAIFRVLRRSITPLLRFLKAANIP